jgi:ferric-dicitrate binding protein FerR (iron transport regulator)
MTRFDRLGEHIAQEQDALRATAGYQAEVRARLTALELPVDLPSARPQSSWRALGWAGSGVVVAAACVLVALSLRAPQVERPPLSLFIGASTEPVPAGRWIEAPAAGEVAIRFSDGSHIEVAERTRARVVDLNPTGADVLLESGLLHVQVRHQADSAWHISAGPFGVRVTGTRFDVRWKPEEDTFELSLREGQVEVTGCVFGQGYRMHAGQTVRASCRNERFDVSIGAVELAAETPSVDTASASVASAQIAPASPQPSAAASNDDSDRDSAKKPVAWQALALAGRFADALAAAKTLGFEVECKRASVAELALLADLARYGRGVAEESRALHLLRERFPGTKRASLAAFGLGRLEFDNHGSHAEAAEWFRVYLKEQPKGALVREASGRLLEALQHAGRAGITRELAAQYLRDYPTGPHAELAHGLAATGTGDRR